MTSELDGDPSVRASSPGYVVAVHGGTLVELIRASDSGFAGAVQKVLRTEGGALVATLVVLEGAIRLPEGATRSELDAVALELGSRPVAVVYEAEDMMVAALRAIHASFARLTNQSMRPELFGSIESAIRWLEREVPELSGIEQLESQVRLLREKFQRL